MFKKRQVCAAIVALLAGSAASGAWAQQQDQAAQGDDGAQKLQRVEVTGSNVRRVDAETPSPVQVLTADDLKKSGYTRVTEVLQALTANGQGTLSQGFSGAFASGASGIALRGLTVGATLVLVDGHRMAPYPIGDDGQRSFVDISQIPFDAVERIEVLKDGASAVYGSDAVAGVVNVILKRSYVGHSIGIDYGVSGKRDGETTHLSGTFGAGDLDKDGQNIYLAAEFRTQNQIKYSDRGGLLSQTDFTSTGGLNVTPGVPNAFNGGLASSRTGYLTDPNNTSNIVGFFPGCDPTSYAAGKCAYKDTWNQIQPATQNINVLSRFTKRLTDDWEMSVAASLFNSEAEQVTAPASAYTAGYQGVAFGPGVAPTLLPALGPTTISSSNPSFPASSTANPANLNYTFLDVGPVITHTDSTTLRLVGDLKGTLGAWDVSAAAGYSRSDLNIDINGSVQAGALQTALDSTTNPYLVGGPNSQSVLDSIAPPLQTKDTSELSFVHLGGSRDLLQLGGGPLSVALGTDYFYRKQHVVAPQAIADGLVNGNNTFTIGAQNVGSAYAELVAPIAKQLEVEGAIRYDHYNLSGGKASPKVGFKFTPVKEFALRGTAAKGFRAPNPAENGNAGQTYLVSAAADPVLCPNGVAVGAFISQCAVNFPHVQTTNSTLKPETSTSYTLGFVFEPVQSFSASVDFYSINLKDQIVTSSDSTIVRGSNLSPLQQVAAVDANGNPTAFVSAVPPVAPIVYETSTYVNANSTKTTGVDLDLIFRTRLQDLGNFKSELTVTHINKYDVTIDGVTYHLAGTHGPIVVSGDTGNPKTRAQWINTFSRGPWSVTGTLNYISSFDLTDPSFGFNTCVDGLFTGAGVAPYYVNYLSQGLVPPGVSCKVAAFKTFDLSAKYDVTKDFQVTGSILNLFNSAPPADWGTYGGAYSTYPFNPSMHTAGAIGRYFTVGAKYTF